MLITPFLLLAEIDIDSVKQQYSVMQKSGIAGREFWVTIPPKIKNVFTRKSVSLYFLSSIKANVSLSIEDKNYNKEFILEPNVLKKYDIERNKIEPIEFDTTKIMRSNIYENSALNIKSDNPIIVYVVSKNGSDSDSYLAIPSIGSSNEYINTTFYSSNYANVLFPCYTSIISNYDNNKVSIKLGGGELEEDEVLLQNGELLRTGDSTSRILNKGDVFLLSANGNLQDISATKIDSDKPISVVSGIYGAEVPYPSRIGDALFNMEMPTIIWGKAYYFTPMNDRDNPALFRIYASEDNTKVYKDSELIGTVEKGGGADFGESYLEVSTDNNFNNVSPISITSDKPVALVYYNTYEKDKDSYYFHNEPHLLQIPPIEQSVNSAIFAVPHIYNETTPLYYLNNTVVTFPLENNQIPSDLVLISYDTLGNEIKRETLRNGYENDFNVFETEYRGKQYGSVSILMDKTLSYQLISKQTKFVTYTYGSDFNTNYSLPTGFSIYDRTKDDNQAPDFIFNRDCDGNINIENSKIIDLPIDSSLRSNIADIYIMANENYEFNWFSKGLFIPGKTKEVSWSLKVIDETKPSIALIYAVDKAGNDTILHIESQPYKNLTFDSDTNEINNPKISKHNFQDTLRNPSKTKAIYITRIEFANESSNYKVESFEPNWWEPGMYIDPNQEIYINYSFENDYLEDSRIYKDSLFIGYGIEIDDAIEECNYVAISELNVTTNFPKYNLYSNNDFGKFDSTSQSKRMFDTLQNQSADRKLFISRIELMYGDKGFSINGYKPNNWINTIPINPQDNLLIDIKFDPSMYNQINQSQVIVDSLGVGVSEYNDDGELSEIYFDYFTEQKAIISAKDPNLSVLNERLFIDYLKIYESNIQILPKARIEGFYKISIFDIVGNLVIEKSIIELNQINISSLQSGTYIIVIADNEKRIVNKFNKLK